MAAANWKPLQRSYYTLHVCLFLLQRLDELYRNQIRYSFAYYDLRGEVYAIRDGLFQELVTQVNEMRPGNLSELSIGRWAETIGFLAEHAFPKAHGPVDWASVYALIWWNLILESPLAAELREQEMTRLAAEARQEMNGSYRKDRLVLAQLLHLVKSGDDQDAMKLVDAQLHDVKLDDFYPYLGYFVENEAWDRLLTWLEWLAPEAAHSPPKQMLEYFAYWEQLKEHLEVEPQWKRMVFGMMPNSYAYYSSYLLEREEFQAWVDLNLLLRTNPLATPSVAIKAVEAKRRELLLPWYHHAAEQFIAEKNREAYKRAVRVLRKLKATYKRLKQQRRWEAYMQYLMKRYSRLRAFQEELSKLRKGEDSA
ncbi:hypothetical protein LJK88_03450 [Paenibacillus sp. P26]|nr:hypothetical protein LJK88_03450 [Paenibacillus sp. P26]